MKNLKSSIRHLAWRLQQNHIRPSNKDLNALNTLIIALNEKLELKQRVNLQLVKFMIHVFGANLSQSMANNKQQFIDFKGASEKLDEIFKMDIDSHLKHLKEDINGHQIDLMIAHNKLTPENIAKRSTQKEVNKCIKTTIHQYLNQYKNV